MYRTLFFLISFLIISCKKDKVVQQEPIDQGGLYDYSHLEETYYCTVDYDMAYESGGTRLNDRNIKLDVLNDSLYFLNYKFKIDSDTQTVFQHYEELQGTYSTTISLTFSNSFTQLYLHYYQSGSGSGGPDYTVIYYGSVTQEIASTIPHVNRSLIEGDYIMEITRKNVFSGLDTTYVDTINVLLHDTQAAFILDGELISTPSFYNTFSNVTNWNFQMDQHDNYQAYWDENDSLYIENLQYSGGFAGNPMDTIQVLFAGTKL
jgi:hypothetical protein